MVDVPPEAPASDDGAPIERARNPMRPSEMGMSEALVTFKSWFQGDATHSQRWRTEAREDFDFIAGDQWDEKDKALLKDQNRQPITFNRSLTIIKAIAGMEVNSRHEIAYLPRKLDDTAVDEVLTGACKWMSDECDGEDEESEAFQNSSICGIGVCEHRMDFEENPKGMYVEESFDPLEYYWDRTARKKNISDRRRDWRVRVMPLGDAQQLFPDKSVAQLDANWAYGYTIHEPKKTLEERRVRDENSTGPLCDQEEVTLVHVEWWEREDCWLVADPRNDQVLTLSTEEYERLQERVQLIEGQKAQANPAYVPQKLTSSKGFRKRFKQAFIGGEILEMGEAKDPERFSRTVITGEFHHNRRVWFGIVRTLRDPQMWSNKWLSQTLHILNSTAKGGIMVEEGVFRDQRDAEQKWARPDGIVEVSKNALSGPNGPKIQAKPGRGDPGTYVELLSMAINATRDVTGINLELIGQKDINQPGILEAMRKQAGMTVLATMFDSLRRMRKQTGRIRLYYIQNYLSDGRIIRITGINGPGGAKSLRLLRDRVLGEYDVVVDDAPTSPNQKEANWAIISSLLPAFKDQLMSRPDILVRILDYSPLPSQMVEAIKQSIAAPAPKSPEQDQLQKLVIAEKVAKISKDQAQAELFQHQAASTEATSMYDLAMARNLLLKHQGDMVSALNEAKKQGLDAAKAQAEAEKSRAEAAHIAAKTQTEQANADNVRAQTASTHAETHRTHIGSWIDALTPIDHKPPSEIKAAPRAA